MVALPLSDALPSDAELIAAARAGNDDAYGQLYSRHVGAARAGARSLTRSRALADDLVGEGFTRVLAALRNGGGPEVAFRPYLLASIRSAFYDRARKDRRVEVTDDVEAVAAAGALELFDPRISLDERHIIAKAFASLPERWQLVLWHTEVEGRSPADVARRLGPRARGHGRAPGALRQLHGHAGGAARRRQHAAPRTGAAHPRRRPRRLP